MKKIIVFCIVVSCIISMSSCQKKAILEGGGDVLKSIYEVGEGVYANEKEFHHANILLNEPESSIDESVPAQRKLVIQDLENHLEYKDTLSYPLFSGKYHRYFVDGEEKKPIFLNADGSVKAILYSFAMLDISKVEKPSDFLPLFYELLSSLLDISHYEHIDVPKLTDSAEILDFLYYNTTAGYITDYLRISVHHHTGEVVALQVHNLQRQDIVLEIDSELETKMINAKLNDIYTTETTKYLSYQLSPIGPPNIVEFEDELYVQYPVTARYLSENGEERESWLNVIMIPTRLIISSAE